MTCKVFTEVKVNETKGKEKEEKKCDDYPVTVQ